ncbi:hypothetical protein OE88DRAFT_1657894 [Heliocybe sulcata]|uniref:Transcription factor CBF/NF-Y/archaeal histone domain-containing protein n=1 Tax=Heliocybe sulcata TaxID=5364 RepID=A0A5C3N5V7_9AGAM|nr:hypothetical protein OE88DRAFT_1657894 [Heliocybe sulcata]
MARRSRGHPTNGYPDLNLPVFGGYPPPPHPDPPAPWSPYGYNDSQFQEGHHLSMNGRGMANGTPPSVRLLSNNVQFTLRPPQPPHLPWHASEEDEEEVDQLDSDTDADAASSMQVDGAHGPSGTAAKRKRRGSVRKVGQTLLPQAIMENILLADGSAGLNMSKEALFVVSIAAEEFIKRLSSDAQYRAAVERRTTLNYRDMANCTHYKREFHFLKDVIPQPTTLAMAIQRRATKDDYVLDEEPPMASLTSSIIPQAASISYTSSGTISIPPMYHHGSYMQHETPPPPSASAASARSSSTSQVKLKIRGPSTNGHENDRMDGRSEAAKSRKRDTRGRWSIAPEELDAGTPQESVSGTRSRHARATTAPGSHGSHARSSRRAHTSASASASRTSSTPSEVFTHEPHWTVLQQQDDSSAEPPESYERGGRPASIGISLSAGLGLGRVRHSPLGDGAWGGYPSGSASVFLGGQGRTIYSTQRERRTSNPGAQR